jgi:SAM-dependent methyltransferase
MAAILCHIDRPAEAQRCDPLGFFVEGWIYDGEGNRDIESIALFAGGQPIGETFALSERSDVSASLGLSAGVRTAFQVYGHFESDPMPKDLAFDVRVRRRDTVTTVARRSVALIDFDYRSGNYGHLLSQGYVPVIHREHVYGSGPSTAGGNEHCLALVEKFMGPPPGRVLDVGCGLGFYGRALRPRGYDWLGVEIKEGDLAELARQALPHLAVDGKTLPFADGSFDAAICIEVLEHIEDVNGFLSETRRVAPRLLLSVPNFEIVTYLSVFMATPWHIHEADHKNFFTRWSLAHLLRQYYRRVEVTAYGEIPIRTREGLPLPYHLFASASA